MSSFKSEQHRLEVQGRTLHFVAYEGHPAHAGRGVSAEPPMWYLMCEGHRKAVMPHLPDQPAAERNAALMAWAMAHTVGPDSGRRPRARAVHEDLE